MVTRWWHWIILLISMSAISHLFFNNFVLNGVSEEEKSHHMHVMYFSLFMVTALMACVSYLGERINEWEEIDEKKRKERKNEAEKNSWSI